MAQPMTRYPKKAKSPEEHIALWQERGLTIPDPERAKRYLRHIGYYRLGGYKIPFETGHDTHFFVQTSSFDDILSLYIFDRKLRLLTLDALERIEVSVRSCIVDTCSIEYGPHWFLNESIFTDINCFSYIIERVSVGIERNLWKSPFKHYAEKYTEPRFPPAWVISDVLDFTVWSKIYKGLRNSNIQREIARHFNLGPEHLSSWMQCLTIVRNTCAHHSQLWDRTLVKKPQGVKRLKGILNCDNRKYYTAAVIIKDMLSSISLSSTWPKRLGQLLNQACPVKYHSHMGFPENWEMTPFWNITPPWFYSI